MAQPEEETSLELLDIKTNQIGDDLFNVKLVTSQGSSKALLHHRPGDVGGTVLVGGAGGGLDGPASIYGDLAPRLLRHGISSLRLDYRRNNRLIDCVLDTMLGVEFLAQLQADSVGLVGWSFGGAVVIEAGVLSDGVHAVVTIASQTYGTDAVDELSPKALLILHGTADPTLPPACSQDIFERAREPKELVLYEGANHGIDERRTEMLEKIEGFLAERLTAG